MAVIKCKMCGGDLEIIEGSTVCECEYCGTKQTVPSADNEKKLTLFNRAGRLLRACEFDKAAGVFETIVADFPQEAEAYWGLVLCKYGIEYVDDPATGKKIPTCHRSSFDSVLDDPNFEQACENTDAIARRVYRDEARQIEELRQAILQVSGKEEPYDVFISYKETDGNGERTLDSVIAQDIYKELTGEGYRVFFSRISLEDKLGTEYEPYIFAALNSAKVMLVVGTDYENFDSVWVKNEWSRFLKLIAKGEKKTLIPVFKNMDAYDMPKEFAKLAAQDMGKVGAMQDLVRGVEKIVGRKKAEPAQPQPMYVGSEADAKTAAAVKRGRLALEEGDMARAKEHFEQALSLDAECAEAYFGMALAGARCRSAEEYLKNATLQMPERKKLCIPRDDAHIRQSVEAKRIPRFLEDKEIEAIYDRADLSYNSYAESMRTIRGKAKQAFVGNRNFTLAFRFAKDSYKEKIEKFRGELSAALDEHVQKAEKTEREAAECKQAEYKAFLERADKEVEELYQQKLIEREELYHELCREYETLGSPDECERIGKQFAELGDYEDSREYSRKCAERRAEREEELRREEEEKRKEKLYREASSVFSSAAAGTIANWETAKKSFESLGDYRDAPACALRCEEAINEIQKAEEAKRKAAAEEAERQRILREKAEAARKKKNKTIGIIAAALAVIAIAAILVVTKVVIPARVERENAAAYAEAQALFDAGDYEAARTAFEALGDYQDSVQRTQEARSAAKYEEASALMKSDQYQQAAVAFTELGDYRDAPERAVLADQEARYLEAKTLLDSESFQDSLAIFEDLERFRDAPDMVLEAKYRWATRLLEGLSTVTSKEELLNRTQQAHDLLESLGSYKNTEELLTHFMRVRVCDRIQDSGYLCYYSYDERGRLNGIPRIDAYKNVRTDSVTYSGNDVSSWYTKFSDATYDSQHRLIGLEEAYSAYGTSMVSYNGKGLISKITCSDSTKSFSYEYADGRVVHGHYQEKTKYSTYSHDQYYSYDANGRITEYTHQDEGSHFQYSYSYNRDGTLAKIEIQNLNNSKNTTTVLVEYGFIFVTEPLPEEVYLQITQQLAQGNVYYMGQGACGGLPYLFTFYAT